jgi:hypothetical protein
MYVALRASSRWAKLDLAWEFLGRQSTWVRCLESQPVFFHACGDGAAAAAGVCVCEKANGF